MTRATERSFFTKNNHAAEYRLEPEKVLSSPVAIQGGLQWLKKSF